MGRARDFGLGLDPTDLRLPAERSKRSQGGDKTVVALVPATKTRKSWEPPDDFPSILREAQVFPSDPAEFAAWLRYNCLEASGTGEVSLTERRLAWALEHSKAILLAAYHYFKPVRVYACFSGGYDSGSATALTMSALPFQPGLSAPSAADRDWRDIVRPLHIDTGIGVEATREYVRTVCHEREWPLMTVKTPVSYEDLVLGRVAGYRGGFPGPPMHRVMYARLKERPIRLAIKAAKEERVPDETQRRQATVMLVSGIRHDESMIRAGYQRCVSKIDSQVWINPLYWATIDDFRAIRELYGIPANAVKDRLGMSGECLCGAYAEKGELLRVRMTCPETADRIEDLERRVRAAGFPWSWEDPGPPKDRKKPCSQIVDGVYTPDTDDFRPMCASCEKTKAVAMTEGD